MDLVEGEFYWVWVRFKPGPALDGTENDWVSRVEPMQFERGEWWVIGRDYGYPKDEPSHVVLSHIEKPPTPDPNSDREG